MPRVSFGALLAVALTLLVPLSSVEGKSVMVCKALPKALQGKWRASKCPPGPERGPCVAKTYTLRERDYLLQGYPPLRVEGKLCVVHGSTPTSVRVSFYNSEMVEGQRRTKWPNRVTTIVVSSDGKTISFDGFVYHRIP